MKFRKKPVVIDAEHYSILGGLNSDFLKKAICGSPHWGHWGNLHIHTLEGLHDVSDGDWIIKGIKGEFYPIKNDIFLLTYDKVED